MKKYLFGALALPLLFACSSEDFDEKVVSNDQFAGIAKVDATFSMDGAFTRMDNGSWNPQEGDLWGFAWMGDGTVIANSPADGKAYQNHNLIQKSKSSGTSYFEPQTSIYVGKYYIYRPYDYTTVSPQAIKFNSLVKQTLAEGYASTTQAWKDLAKTAINIGDKWTTVTATGWTDLAGNTWDKAGIKQNYELYAAMFSNQTGLDLTYVKNNPTFAAAKRVQGATDIDYTYAAGTAVGAADIYEATVNLSGQAKSFTYAPTKEPNTAIHDGGFWADKKGLPTAAEDGFTFTAGAVTLIPEDAVNGLSTGDNGSTAWFWFNSLPNTAGTAVNTDNVTTVFTTSYGVVTVTEQLKDCAYAFEQPKGAAASAPKEWIKLAAATDQTKTPKEWDPAVENTFVNQYGNHKGKYALTVDFATGDMDKMHIKSDTHLQKLLKYYLASGKTAGGITLLLDKDADNEFKISKISIALLQTINAGGVKVLVKACDEVDGVASTAHTPGKIVITQDGQAALGLADATEVPELDDVFAVATDVYLASNTTWTWKERSGANRLTIDANVASITNLGTLKVNATNIETNPKVLLTNAAGATMNITKVTTVKNNLTNLGTINVGAADNTGAELRAYGIQIKNDATGYEDSKQGVINNYGVVGVTAGTGGTFNNYGTIKMKNAAAMTLLTTNELTANFAANWGVANKMGTVELPDNNPTAIVSVNNATDTGFIKYTLPDGDPTTYATPTGNVKFNTIVVKKDITFNAVEDEIQFIQFQGIRTQVVNPAAANLPNLKGVIVDAGKSIIIEKGNVINCSVGAYLGAGATVYRGGTFGYVSTTNYFGNWSTDQIIEY